YILVTLHRPSNVDDAEQFRELIDAIHRVSAETRLPVVWPVHPRVGLSKDVESVNAAARMFLTVGPQTYTDMLSLTAGARLVLTDSGGLQEETTYLRVPCVTLRDSTERPVTLASNGGTNYLPTDLSV